MSMHEAHHDPAAGGAARRGAARTRARRMARAPSVLLVTNDDAWLSLVESTLAGSEINCRAVRTAALARLALGSDDGGPSGGPRYEVALIDARLPDGAGLDLADEARRSGVGAVIASRRGRLDDVVTAMRSGVYDYLIGRVEPADLRRRLDSAVDRARATREREERVDRLKRVCRRLSSARRRVVRQVDSLCTDLVQAYQELAEQMNQVTTAAEFSSLVRQELDIESLLRTTLEFVLARTGPTNAAIFLPTTSGDFSLGAYVNYDCPKDTADILLDHLANAVAPRFEGHISPAHLRTEDEFDQFIGEDADWLAESEVIGLSCEHDDETLAIMMLFRDRRTPFQDPIDQQLETIGSLFADQLARVIQVHHRHLPKYKWGAPGDAEDDRDDYGDLAA